MLISLKSNWFFWYFMITGIIMLSWFSVSTLCGDRKEKIRDITADTAWDTGLSGECILCIVALSMLLFGWVFLPYKFLRKVGILLGIVKEEEE